MLQCVEIPVEAQAGLSFAATVTGAPAGYALALILRGPAQIDLVGDAQGRFQAGGTTTASWAPGAYWWAVRATLGDDVQEIERGDILIRPDLAAAGPGYDGRSENQIALDAIKAVLAKRATLDQERYRINNRELHRTPIADLIKLRTFYAAQVRRENPRASGASRWGRAIPVRLS